MRKWMVVWVAALLVLPQLNFGATSQLKDELDQTFGKGKFLILKMSNIPSVGVNKVETLGFNNYVHLKIQPDGTWKEKKILGMSKTTSRLERGCILKVRKTKLKGDSYGIFTKTEKTILIDLIHFIC